MHKFIALAIFISGLTEVMGQGRPEISNFNQGQNFFTGIRCYVSPSHFGQDGYDVIQQCPPQSRGCTKKVIYTESGLTTTDKQCGAPIDTNEGCDTIDVPIKMEECYCTTDLCNGGTGSNLAFGTLIMSFI